MTRKRDEMCSCLDNRRRCCIVCTLLCRVDRLDLTCVERANSCSVFDEDWSQRYNRIFDGDFVLLNLCSGSANRAGRPRPPRGGLYESRSGINELIRTCIEANILAIDRCRRALPLVVPFVCPHERCE